MSLELQKKELLHFLSSHQGVSYEALADRLKVSIRSVKLLVESLLYRYGHVFSIQENRGCLSLYIYEEEAFRLLVTEHLLQETDFNSFHKRQALFFQILLEAEQYCSADEISEKLGISRRSLSRDMVRMKGILERYGLLLETKTGVGIRVKGSELSKRLLYLYEVMDYLEEDSDLPEEVYTTYVDIIKSKQFPLDVERTFFKTLLLTWRRRHYSLEQEDFTWFTWQEQLDLPPIFYEIFSYYLGRSISELERVFLVFPMQLGLLAAEVERVDILQLSKDVLAFTIEEYGIQLEVAESAQLLQRHLVYMLNRSVMKWEFTEVGLRQDLLRSSFSHVVAQFFIQRVEELVALPISDKEVVLLAAWMDLLLAKKSKPLVSRIAVISQAGLPFNRLVEQQIRQFFGQQVVVEFLEFVNHLPYEQLSQQYDLVFTDNLLYSQELFQSFLSLTLVTKENQAEREQMERMVLARKIQLYCRVLLANFADTTGYEENLQHLLVKLRQKGLIDEQTTIRLLEKEQKAPAVSDSGFAFPHVTMADLEQMTLVFASKEAVHLPQASGQIVSDFILLLIPDTLDELQQDLLYQLFDNTFRLQEQSTIKDRLGIVHMTNLPILELRL